MERRLRAIPGVTDVGLISQLPLTGSGPLSPFAYNEATARRLGERDVRRPERVADVLPRHGDAAHRRPRLRRPRLRPQQNAIIVDETLAARAWPGESAVGKRLQVQPNGNPNNFAEVVGVVEHIRAHDLVARGAAADLLAAWAPAAESRSSFAPPSIPASLASAGTRAMKRLDPDLPLDRLQPMSAYVADALGQTRLNLILMSLFGGAALLLSCVGIYGVFWYAVSQRTREIGIRMALGQAPGGIRNLVLKEAAVLIVKSTVLGIGAAFLLGRAVSSLLYQITPGDPATFAAGALCSRPRRSRGATSRPGVRPR